MEWFKCANCSQQLDKPELYYHFLICPAKLKLLQHGDGKKHGENVQVHMATQQPSVEAVAETDDSAEDNAKTEASPDGKLTEALGEDNSLSESRNLSVLKKRKMDANDDGSTDNCLNRLGNGIAIQAGVQETQKVKKAKLEPVVNSAERKETHHEAGKEVQVDEDNARKESGKEKVNWRKLIVSVLKDVPDGALKMRKLQKIVLKRLVESGVVVNDTDFSSILEYKVNSSSKVTVDGKYVRLAA